MAQLIFAVPEAARIKFGESSYPTSIIVERKDDREGRLSEYDEERINNLEKVVFAQETLIKILQTDCKTAHGQIEILQQQNAQNPQVSASGVASSENLEQRDVPLNEEFDEEESDCCDSEYDDSDESVYDEKIEEVKDNEEPLALKDVLRLIEHSAKAIDLMNEHQFSTVWSQCSSNTYGFFIRNVLLCGSSFNHQLIPDSLDLMAISVLGVIFSAGMQFMLAYYLWVNLPPIYPLITGNGNVLKPFPGLSTSDENGTYVSGRGYFQAKSGFCFAPDCLSAPLPSYQFPDYSAANDVCRTQSIVQIICIGLFLFSVLTNVPGIIKNCLIIAWSERFLSQDEDSVTKIHYWRESDFSREPQPQFLDQKQAGEAAEIPSAAAPLGPKPPSPQYKAKVHRLCKYFETFEFPEGSGAKPIHLRSAMLDEFYLPLSGFGKLGFVRRIESLWGYFRAKEVQHGDRLSGLPRSFFEIADSRQFLSEILQDLDSENRERKSFEGKAGSQDKLAYAEGVKFNLVRADYLKPNGWSRPFAYRFLKNEKERSKTALQEQKRLKFEAEQARHSGLQYIASNPTLKKPEPEELTESEMLEKKLDDLKELKDQKTVKKLYMDYPARMRRFRFLAFLIGVIPEVMSLIVVTFAGVQYILWSGFKIGSDSRGMEEIILATLAICFVYDIDDTLYDHVLPELYKKVHEQDRFELRSWVSSSAPSSASEAQNLSFFWKILSFQTRYFFASVFPNVRKPRLDIVSEIQKSGRAEGKEGGPARLVMLGALKRAPRLSRDIAAFQPAQVTAAESMREAATRYTTGNDEDWKREVAEIAEEKKRKREEEQRTVAEAMTADFEAKMLITVARAKYMSSRSFSDFYLARQYPFFYARKFHMHFDTHLLEGFLVWYGRLGLHFLILLALALSIVGAYRSAARCDRFASPASIWSTQEWPSTCVMNIAEKTAAKFKDLRGRAADLLVPVSCGLSGYLPSDEEWQANKDFFLDKR